MKKTFNFSEPKKKREQNLDVIRHQINKYVARERRKKLEDELDYWAFDCKIGTTTEGAEFIRIGDISAKIGDYFSNNEESFYIEILAKAKKKPVVKNKKPKAKV